MFSKNVGSADRTLRIVLGVVLLGAFFFAPFTGVLHWLMLLGVVAIVTGLISWCPLYSVLGISTCPLKS